jgi:predicted transcriptional regulator
MKKAKVKDYMTMCEVTFDKDMDIAVAVELLLATHQSGGPVIDDQQRVIGFLSEQDCIHKMIESSYTGKSTGTVENIMKTNTLTLSVENSMMGLAEQMTLPKPKVYPVVDEDEKLIGIITRRDVLSALDEYFHSALR